VQILYTYAKTTC